MDRTDQERTRGNYRLAIILGLVALAFFIGSLFIEL